MKKIFTLSFLIFSLHAMAQSGITWSPASNIATSASGNMHPRIALDGSGNPLVIWGNMTDQSVQFAKWNGAGFNPPVQLNPAWLTVATASWMGPQIASHGDLVYIVVKQTPEADTASHIYLIRSFDGGITFMAPIKVDNILDSMSRFPTVTTDSIGNPIIGFMKFDPGFSKARWVVTRSFDMGSTFTTDAQASGWTGGYVCDCCPGAVTCSGNTIAMLYRNQTSNIRDSWAGLSTDGGISFSGGWNVDNHNWSLFACPSTGPDAEIIGDSLYSVFTNGASGIYRTYRSVSSISSGMAQPSQLLTGAIPNLNSQNYPRIARYGNAMAIAWKQTVNNAEQLPILFTGNIQNGFPARYDTVDLNNVTNTDVTVGNGYLFVVWEDDGTGTVKYRKGSYTMTTSVNESSGNSLSIYPNPFTTELTINLNKQGNGENEISLFDVTGEKILRLKISEAETKLNTEKLSAGFYLLNFNNANFKLVKF